MSTYNVFSAFSYDALIDKVFEYKKKHANGQRYWISAIQLDTAYLRWPRHLSVKILEPEQKESILKSAEKALYYGIKEFTKDNYGFSNVEIQKMKRLYDYAVGKDDFDVDKYRKDFVRYVDEYDKRRGTNFLETFPQLEKIYVENK